MNEPVVIDPEFQNLIPPLSGEEYRQLEENCRRDGIVDSLKVWHGILVDGHNRYRISEEWDLNYRVEEMDFPDRSAVIRWIILNQFGRRNLSAFDRSILALKLKPVIAEKAKEKEIERKTTYQKSEKSNLPKIDTTKELAKVAGVSHDTIHKVEIIETKASEPLKQQVRNGEKTINQAWLELKKQNQKEFAIGVRERLGEAQKRHNEFKEQKTVSMEAVKQDQKDSSEIAESKAGEIQNALKKILFIGAASCGGDMDFSEIKKSLSKTSYLHLVTDISNAISILSKLKEWLA